MTAGKHRALYRRLVEQEEAWSIVPANCPFGLATAKMLRNRLCTIDWLERQDEVELDHETLVTLREMQPVHAKEVLATVPPGYDFAAVLGDEQRLFKLWRKWRTARNGGEPLTPAEDIEHAFLAAHYVLKEHSPEAIAAREARKAEDERRSRELIEINGGESYVDSPALFRKQEQRLGASKHRPGASKPSGERAV